LLYQNITMKKILFLLILTPFLITCDSEDFNNANPYLPNYGFSIDIDLNLPSNSQLNFISNAIKYNDPGVGVRGIIVFNAGNGVFNAFDAACPNQPLAACSTMTISGVNAVCPCDNASYSLFTGQGNLEYPLKRYRVQVNGSIIRVYN